MPQKNYTKSVGGLALVVVLALGNHFYPGVFNELRGLSEQAKPAALSQSRAANHPASNGGQGGFATIRRAVNEQQSEVWFEETRFNVVKLLEDDLRGSRHQRFLVKQSGLPTLLVAHNIDLARRIPVQEGEVLMIRGRYEWNEKGGVIHWTHHDPKNKITGGWIVYDGKKYN